MCICSCLWWYIVITGNDEHTIITLKSFLHCKFHITDLGALKYFLGIEVACSQQGIFISQRKCTLGLLQDMGMLGTSTTNFPTEQNLKPTSIEGSLLDDPTSYRRLVGRLSYLTITRLDTTYSIHILSQFTGQPWQPHYDTTLRVHFLKDTLGQCLLLSSSSSLHLLAYHDSDWASCLMTQCPVTGYCTFLGDSTISWKTKKQKIYSRSSAETKYQSMAAATY